MLTAALNDVDQELLKVALTKAEEELLSTALTAAKEDLLRTALSPPVNAAFLEVNSMRLHYKCFDYMSFRWLSLPVLLSFLQ